MQYVSLACLRDWFTRAKGWLANQKCPDVTRCFQLTSCLAGWPDTWLAGALGVIVGIKGKPAMMLHHMFIIQERALHDVFATLARLRDRFARATGWLANRKCLVGKRYFKLTNCLIGWPATSLAGKLGGCPNG
jgi:hypothetical protein